MAPGTQRVLRERLLSDLATLPRTRHVAQDKFLQLIETQFPQLQRGRNLLPSVAERIPEQLRKTWKDSEHHTGSPSIFFSRKNHSLPCKTPFSLLRPTPSPYSVTGLITLLTHVPLPRPPPHSSSWPGHFPGTGRGPDSTRQTGTVISWRGLGMGVQKAKNLGKSRASWP